MSGYYFLSDRMGGFEAPPRTHLLLRNLSLMNSLYFLHLEYVSKKRMTIRILREEETTIYIYLGWDKMKSNKQGKTNQMEWKNFYHPYMYLSSMDPI